MCHFWEHGKGEYLHPLTAVNIDTRWCELAGLSNRSQKSVQEAIDQIQGNLPFPLLGSIPTTIVLSRTENFPGTARPTRSRSSVFGRTRRMAGLMRKRRTGERQRLVSKERVGSKVRKKYDRAQIL